MFVQPNSLSGTMFHIPELTGAVNNTTTSATAVAQNGPKVVDDYVVKHYSNTYSGYDREENNEV